MIKTPPSDWLEYLDKGGVLALLIVAVGVISYLYWKEKQKNDALQETRIEEKVELIQTVLKSQHQTSSALKDNAVVLQSLRDEITRRA